MGFLRQTWALEDLSEERSSGLSSVKMPLQHLKTAFGAPESRKEHIFGFFLHFPC